jgi:hypothetical protein
MGEKNADRTGILLWAALGVLGGAAAGVLEAATAGARNTLVVSESPLANFLAREWFGLTFYSQVFLVVMLTAGLFYRRLSPWPRRAVRREREGGAALATLLTAIAGLYAGLFVNAWLPGVRSWQSLLGNAAVLLGCLALLLVLFRLLRKVKLPQRTLLPAAIAVEALAAIALANWGFYLETSPPPAGEQPRGPNVLLITVDTLRADHLSAYGYRRIRTPGIDRLAAEGVLIAGHYAATSWTLPTLTSLHTGIHPDVHGQIAADLRLDDGLTTMAEVFREGGYLTAGFVTNAYLLPQLGLHRGFDVYVHAGDHTSDPTFGGLLLYRFWRPRDIVRHAAEAVTDRAVRFLTRHGDRLFFRLAALYRSPPALRRLVHARPAGLRPRSAGDARENGEQHRRLSQTGPGSRRRRPAPSERNLRRGDRLCGSADRPPAGGPGRAGFGARHDRCPDRRPRRGILGARLSFPRLHPLRRSGASAAVDPPAGRTGARNAPVAPVGHGGSGADALRVGRPAAPQGLRRPQSGRRLER